MNLRRDKEIKSWIDHCVCTGERERQRERERERERETSRKN